MKNLLRNFYLTLIRFKTASILNILGLTVAFTVFIIIMTQTHWELTYNKEIKQHEQIYRANCKYYNTLYRTICRPLGEAIGSAASAVACYTVTTDPGYYDFQYSDSQGEKKEQSAYYNRVSSSFPDVFSLEAIAGDFKRLEEPKAAIINKSLAENLFPDGNPVGNTIINLGEKDTLQIVAVYKDLPNNCTFRNGIYSNMGEYCMNYRSEWSFSYFYKLASPNLKPEFEKQVITIIKDFVDNIKESDENTEDEADVYEPAFESFSDLYYSSNSGYQAGNKDLTKLLIAIAVIIVLIAVINYINFFMALVPIRIKWVNINKVFGTPTSALRLNIIGEAIGLLLLSFGLSLLAVEYLSDTLVGDLIDTSLKFKDNLFIVIMTAVMIIATGILAGLFPAFYITKFNPALTLKGSFGRSKQGQRLRSILVGFQFTISIALIISACFVYLQSRYMQKYDYGFNRDRLATVWVGGKIASQPQAFLSELKKNPAIEDVAYADNAIVSIGMGWGRMYKGENIYHLCLPVSWNYPEFMGLQLIEGRYFIEEDASKKGGTFIFNEAAAKKYNLKVGNFMIGHNGEEEAEIVGIIKDFNYTSLKNDITPLALYEFGSEGWHYPSMAYFRLSSNADFKETSDFIASAMQAVDPSVKIENIKVTPFDRNIENLYYKEIKFTKTISLFSIMAIIISLMGVFGIVVFENQHRRKEIAIRKIHGSTARLILGMFNRKFIIILLICFVIAAPIAYFGVTKWLSGFAYRIPVFWWVFVAGFLVVAFITLLTVTLQTFRSANENPAWALKTE